MTKLLSTLTVAFTLTACGGLDTTFTYVGDDAEPALTSCQMLENGLTVCLNYDADCYAEDDDTVVCNSEPEETVQTIGAVRAPRVVTEERPELDLDGGREILPELTPSFIQEACEACPSCAQDSCIACYICSTARNHHQLITDDRFDDQDDDDNIDVDNDNDPDHTSRW